MRGNVLVVDDQLRARRLLVTELRDAGFEVCEAGNGADGWDEFVRRRPDVVITDMVMPRADGLELLAAHPRAVRDAGHRLHRLRHAADRGLGLQGRRRRLRLLARRRHRRPGRAGRRRDQRHGAGRGASRHRGPLRRQEPRDRARARAPLGPGAARDAGAAGRGAGQRARHGRAQPARLRRDGRLGVGAPRPARARARAQAGAAGRRLSRRHRALPRGGADLVGATPGRVGGRGLPSPAARARVHLRAAARA